MQVQLSDDEDLYAVDTDTLGRFYTMATSKKNARDKVAQSLKAPMIYGPKGQRDMPKVKITKVALLEHTWNPELFIWGMKDF